MKKIIRIVLLTIAIFGTGLLAEDKASAAVKIDATNFPDEYVRTTVLEKDNNKDGILSDEELANVKEIKIGNWKLSHNQVITTFKGMEHFINLSVINLNRVEASENLLKYFPNVKGILSDTDAKVSIQGTAPSLEYIIGNMCEFTVLDIQAPKLKEIDFSRASVPKTYRISAPNLEKIYFEGIGNGNIKGIQADGAKVRKISLVWGGYPDSSLDFSKYQNLEELECTYQSNVTSINVSKLKNLKRLTVQGCKLKSLNIKNNTKLKYLAAVYNQLKAINVTKNKALEFLDISGNKIRKLDVTKNRKLETLVIVNLSLKKLDMSKNTKLRHYGHEGAKIGKIILPVLKKYVIRSQGYYNDLDDPSPSYKAKISVLDLSNLKSLKYFKSSDWGRITLKNDFCKKKYSLKTVIINKKLKKSDKKYIKKLAKKCKAKVVTKK